MIVKSSVSDGNTVDVISSVGSTSAFNSLPLSKSAPATTSSYPALVALFDNVLPVSSKS